MKFINLLFIYINFLIGGVIYCLNRKHLLIMLLMLEFIILNLFMLIVVYLRIIGLDYYYLILFFVISVCEGVLGLSLLVYMIRFLGNDYFYIFNVF